MYAAAFPAPYAGAHALELGGDLLQGAIWYRGEDAGDQAGQPAITELPRRAIQQFASMMPSAARTTTSVSSGLMPLSQRRTGRQGGHLCLGHPSVDHQAA
jgi:hypothetical protein